MDFEFSDRVMELTDNVRNFIDEHVIPAEPIYAQQVEDGGRWCAPAVMEELKEKARAAGIWNMFLPDSKGGYGLSNLDYAPIAELLGRSGLASEAFNCSAPDTGNMEIIERFGTEEHKEKWLKPLLDGKIRSAFAKVKHRGHDLIAFQVLDRAETTFSFDDPAAFEGLEDEPTIRIDPRTLRKDYLEALNGHIDQIASIARSFGFDHHIVDTHTWLGPTLASFVAKRNAAQRRKSPR